MCWGFDQYKTEGSSILRFSLLSLVGLVALVAFEMITLKTPTANRLAIVGYMVYLSLLTATWGAFCLKGRIQQFCKGVAVLSWACVFANTFVREDYFLTNKSSLLARTVAELLEHPIPSDQDAFSSGSSSADNWVFFKIWNYWVILNGGVLGGFLSLQIRNPLVAAPRENISTASQQPQAIAPISISSSVSENQ